MSELKKASMKYEILVLKGGGIYEREVSMMTGENVESNLRKMGHNVNSVDIERVDIIQYLQGLNRKPDLIFNCLHGKVGEDGTIQAILDWFDLKYTHSGIASSAVAMDKDLSAQIAEGYGIICPLSYTMTMEDYINKNYWGKHIIKPINNGSSVGVRVINSPEAKSIAEAASRLENAPIREDGKLIVQEYIPGIDLSVPVLCGYSIGCVEIKTREEIYSETCKYDGTSIHTLFNETTIKHKACLWAEKMHAALKCSGITRADFRYNPDIPEDKGLYYLETNTQPGLCALSIIPKMLEMQGSSLSNILKIIIDDVMGVDKVECVKVPKYSDYAASANEF